MILRMGLAGPHVIQLDERSTDFATGGVSIVVSSTSAAGTPVLARAVGCRVSRDRRKVSILFARSHAVPVIEAIAFSKRVAAVFSQPQTHRALQLKGRDAVVALPKPGDKGLAGTYVTKLVAEVCRIGFTEGLVRAFVGSDPDDLVVVTFSPDEAFEQTPGPRAGNKLQTFGS